MLCCVTHTPIKKDTIMDTTDDGTSICSPLTLAALIPWFSLAIYRTLGAESRADGTTIATISGALIAVLLLSIGLPYLVYRLSKKSTRAALITLLIDAVLGLVGKGVKARDDQGRELSSDIARPRHLDEAEEAEANVKDAIDALRKANQG